VAQRHWERVPHTWLHAVAKINAMLSRMNTSWWCHTVCTHLQLHVPQRDSSTLDARPVNGAHCQLLRAASSCRACGLAAAINTRVLLHVDLRGRCSGARTGLAPRRAALSRRLALRADATAGGGSVAVHATLGRIGCNCSALSLLAALQNVTNNSFRRHVKLGAGVCAGRTPARGAAGSDATANRRWRQRRHASRRCDRCTAASAAAVDTVADATSCCSAAVHAAHRVIIHGRSFSARGPSSGSHRFFSFFFYNGCLVRKSTPATATATATNSLLGGNKHGDARSRMGVASTTVADSSRLSTLQRSSSHDAQSSL
jgi:hypothetical protein